MKKVFLLALFAGLTTIACSKKENANTESNVMLQEPEVTEVAVDSAAVEQPAVSTTTAEAEQPAVADSTVTK
ncbi:hypothetical protein [Riemerella columbina]|uniref:hypothetical protein n=1 Tax=Riemerella columbina TaxID=103810 RepID=UPI0003699A20|nr:hypothetical protein [Riemerella columbina]